MFHERKFSWPKGNYEWNPVELHNLFCEMRIDIPSSIYVWLLVMYNLTPKYPVEHSLRQYAGAWIENMTVFMARIKGCIHIQIWIGTQ